MVTTSAFENTHEDVLYTLAKNIELIYHQYKDVEEFLVNTIRSATKMLDADQYKLIYVFIVGLPNKKYKTIARAEMPENDLIITEKSQLSVAAA